MLLRLRYNHVLNVLFNTETIVFEIERDSQTMMVELLFFDWLISIEK